MAHGMADYRLHKHQENAPTRLTFNVPVLLHDTMESGNWKWNNSGNPAGWSAGFDAAAAYFEGTGGRLQTTGTTPAAGDWVQIDRDVIITDSPEIALSMLFRIQNPRFQVQYITISARRQEYETIMLPGIRYDGVNDRWLVNALGIGWVTFLENSLLGSNHWHRLSLLNNATLGTYGLFQVDNHIVNLSGYSFPAAPNFDEEYTNISIRVETAGANQVTVDLDNIILQTI